MTDETNRHPSGDVKFFVYGGLLLPVERMHELDRGIQRIRDENGYVQTDILKFDTNARPEHVSHAEATEAKKEVVQLCLGLDCKFIVHIIHHDVIRNQDPARQLHWAINYVIGGFNYYLREIGDYGICVVDNLPIEGQWQFLSNKFSLGLDLASGSTVRLDRIKLFAASCIGASHSMSAMDIVLGSFRYCINNPQNPEAASDMMLKVVRMMWHRYDPDTDTYHIHPRGFIVRPSYTEDRYAGFREDYDNLFHHINDLLLRSGVEEQSRAE